MDGGGNDVPLCVDLDDTLVRGDTLAETVIALARQRPGDLWRMPGWLLAGKARLKEELARRAVLDVATLPYHDALIDFLRDEHRRGRRLVLATAAHRLTAQRVADHLGLFSEVVASADGVNVKGANKAAALVERFGEKGFDYAGDAGVDVAVWKHAHAAVVIGGATRQRQAAAVTTVARSFAGGEPLLIGLAEAARPQQWVKNLLVAVPLLTAHAWGDSAARIATLTCLIAWCVTASGAYLINDVVDLDADRRHPHKRRRPCAAGRVRPTSALIAGALLLAGGIALAASASPTAAWTLTVYAMVALLYSAWLKTLAILDVLVLAGLYGARLIGGGFASGHTVSPWLLAFGGFLFLSLAFMKRCGDLYRAGGQGHEPETRRGYRTGDLPILTLFGVVSGFISALVLALYVSTDVARGLYRVPLLLWAGVPLLIGWLCRLWLATARGEMSHDPVAYALRDRATWIILALAAACVGLAARGG